jgi:hypothetical protein
VYRQKFLLALGVFPDEFSGVPPEKFADFIRADREGYAEMVKVLGIEKR